MKVELLRSIVAAGQARKVGDVVELSAHEFDFLASRGLVKEVAKNLLNDEERPQDVEEDKKLVSRKASSKKADK
ncbi:hypothetical protein [Fastidiosibacter lacustris]|uniref:hypothetical protein n=1 Tax=Fastidiosibacter lacustris TaxID=2056695 RepID=UPI000E346BE4|nr:hypothetical protein [Fastidiosibacter lacustris]